MKQSRGPVLNDLLNKRASGSVVEAWVELERRSNRRAFLTLLQNERLLRLGDFGQ